MRCESLVLMILQNKTLDIYLRVGDLESRQETIAYVFVSKANPGGWTLHTMYTLT